MHNNEYRIEYSYIPNVSLPFSGSLEHYFQIPLPNFARKWRIPHNGGTRVKILRTLEVFQSEYFIGETFHACPGHFWGEKIYEKSDRFVSASCKEGVVITK